MLYVDYFPIPHFLYPFIPYILTQSAWPQIWASAILAAFPGKSPWTWGKGLDAGLSCFFSKKFLMHLLRFLVCRCVSHGASLQVSYFNWGVKLFLHKVFKWMAYDEIS